VDQPKTKYVVLRDTVLPREGGGMITLKAGKELTDPYYERFSDAGVFRVEKTEEYVPEDTDPDKDTDTDPDEKQDETKTPTKEELEALSKTKLQSIAGKGVKGSKAVLIEHILKG